MKRSELVFTVVVAASASGASASLAAHSASSARRVDTLETRSLTLIDSKDRPIAVLSSTRDSPEFVLLDQRRRKRAALFLEENGTPDLYLYDSAGIARAGLDLYDSGIPNLSFAAASGSTNTPAILLEATQEGNIRIAFHDFQKKRVVGSMEFKTVGGVPTLALIDDSGKTLWSTQVTR